MWDRDLDGGGKSVTSPRFPNARGGPRQTSVFACDAPGLASRYYPIVAHHFLKLTG